MNTLTKFIGLFFITISLLTLWGKSLQPVVKITPRYKIPPYTPPKFVPDYNSNLNPNDFDNIDSIRDEILFNYGTETY